MDSRYSLPPIQSIWIDEDQYIEKLYGFQMEQLLCREEFCVNSGTNNNGIDKDKSNNKLDSTVEDDMRILIINSSTPQLGNKKNIDLSPPLPPKPINDEIKQVNSTTTKLTTKNYIKLSIQRFKERANMNKSKIQAASVKISIPFGFQHISHGDQPKQENRSIQSAITPSDTIQEEEECAGSTNTNLTTPKSGAFSVFCTPPRLDRENRHSYQSLAYCNNNNGNTLDSDKIFELDRFKETLPSPSKTLVSTTKNCI